MKIKNIFSLEVTDQIIARILSLQPTTTPQWGTMNVSQMLAHCSVAYEMVYTDMHPKPNPFVKFIIKLVAKKAVVSDKPFSKNGRTAPQFLIVNERDFEKEKQRLISYIRKTQELGADFFENKESHSFGKLSSKEWNTMFYKHMDHHLRQFGV
ncbi:DUF1569 domain-containing protein [Tenacibaculum geojense]|uniref:DUF1569 domain-containing protein n=1 Tax=Tenacibaculum geojense TaxID=915352 RepID=A0ABW3JS19_9FLAO